MALHGQLQYNHCMTRRGGIIIEFINVGQLVKVNAVCERTGREVSMVGDPRASRGELERLAAKKLRYVLEKEAHQNQKNKKGFSI